MRQLASGGQPPPAWRAAPGGGVLLTNIGTPWLAHGLRPRAGPADQLHHPGQCRRLPTAADYTVSSAAGYPAITGGGSIQRPVNHVLPAWDIACAYQAAFAIVAAQLRRRQSGAGAELKIALSDIAFTMLSHLGVLAETQLLAASGRRSVTTSTAPSGATWHRRRQRQRGGIRRAVARWSRPATRAMPSRRWKRLGRNLDDEAERHAARDELAALFEPWFAARPYAEVAAAMDAHQGCAGAPTAPWAS